MAAIDVSALTGGLSTIISGLGNINLGDIAANVAMGTVASAAVAGLASPDVQAKLDPLHLIHKDGSQTITGGKTMPASVFSALDAASKASVLSAGYTIVAG